MAFKGAGVIAVILTGVWMGSYRGGFAWQSTPKLEFNWHPMLMVLGLIYLYGNGKIIIVVKDALNSITFGFSLHEFNPMLN